MANLVTLEEFQKNAQLQARKDRLNAAAAPFVVAAKIGLMVAFGVWVYRTVMKGK